MSSIFRRRRGKSFFERASGIPWKDTLIIGSLAHYVGRERTKGAQVLLGENEQIRGEIAKKEEELEQVKEELEVEKQAKEVEEVKVTVTPEQVNEKRLTKLETLIGAPGKAPRGEIRIVEIAPNGKVKYHTRAKRGLPRLYRDLGREMETKLKAPAKIGKTSIYSMVMEGKKLQWFNEENLEDIPVVKPEDMSEENYKRAKKEREDYDKNKTLIFAEGNTVEARDRLLRAMRDNVDVVKRLKLDE